MDDADFRIRPGQFVHDLSGRIGAAIVHDDHFEIGRQGGGRLPGGNDKARNRPAVVVGREEEC